MKKITALLLCSLIFLTSCGTMGTGTAAGAGGSASYTAGQSIGNVIKTLFAQYKSTGSVNLKDPNTLLSLASLAGSYQSIKSSLANKGNYADLLAGMITGSANAVANEKSASSILGLFDNLDLSQLVATKASQGLEQTVEKQVDKTLTDMFALLSK